MCNFVQSFFLIGCINEITSKQFKGNVREKAVVSLTVPNSIIGDLDKPVTILHYFWCDTGHFHFRHFLAIRSAVRTFRPQVVILHAAQKPTEAPSTFEWFEDVKRDVALLKVNLSAKAKCLNNGIPDLSYISSVCDKAYTNVLLQHGIVMGVNYQHVRQDLANVILVTEQSVRPSLQSWFALRQLPVWFIECKTVEFPTLSAHWSNASFSDTNNGQTISFEKCCLQIKNEIFVREVFESHNPILSFLRQIAYGSSDIIRPVKYSTTSVSKIGHYVRVDGNATKFQVDFTFYMSILSLFGVVKLNCVFIHGNVQPDGMLWHDLIKRNFCVRWKKWPLPTTIWQQPVNVLQHQADVLRAEIFVMYGGLHVDPDVFFYRPFADEFWHYHAVIALDAHVAAPGCEQAPREVRSKINLSVCMSRPGSRFFKLYRESLKMYYDHLWTYNSGEKPLQIYERNPSLALLASRMQVVCVQNKCYPGWAKNDEEAHQLANEPYRWLNNTNSIHTAWPDPPEFTSPKTIRTSKTIFGEVARRILSSNKIELVEVERMQKHLKVKTK